MFAYLPLLLLLFLLLLVCGRTVRLTVTLVGMGEGSGLYDPNIHPFAPPVIEGPMFDPSGEFTPEGGQVAAVPVSVPVVVGTRSMNF